MENRKRNVQIIIRVTEEERALIEEKMQQIPTLNLSAYARKMLIDGYITLDLQEVKGHTAQLQKIGVNINQIAKRINETGRIYADDMDEIKRAMEESLAIGTAAASAIQGLNEMRVWDTSQASAPAGEACEGTSKMLRQQTGIFTRTAIRSLCLLFSFIF